MGLIREPKGVDFIISGGPLSPEAAAEVSAFLRKGREAHAKAEAARAKLEAQALALSTAERMRLAHRLLSSLVAEESHEPERAWAAAAVVQFEQLKPVPSVARPAAKTRRTVKAREKTKPAAMKKR